MVPTVFLLLHFIGTSLHTGPDVFSVGEVVTPAHAENVLYCVGSNFLEVKQLATTLLQQLPPSAVKLQVKILICQIII